LYAAAAGFSRGHGVPRPVPWWSDFAIPAPERDVQGYGGEVEVLSGLLETSYLAVFDLGCEVEGVEFVGEGNVCLVVALAQAEDGGSVKEGGNLEEELIGEACESDSRYSSRVVENLERVVDNLSPLNVLPIVCTVDKRTPFVLKCVLKIDRSWRGFCIPD
jgi:hypothetical protein